MPTTRVERAMPTTPPWKRKRPRQPRKPLTPGQKAWARAAARAAGRPYPNLVDNMNAAKQPLSCHPRARLG
jgi:hypothetical protein